MALEDHEETRRQFGIIAEGLRSEIRQVAEGIANNHEAIERHNTEFQAVRGELQLLRSDTVRGFQAVRADMAGEFQAVRAETAKEFKAVRAEAQVFRAETAHEFKAFRAETAHNFADVRADIAGTYGDLDRRLRAVENR